MKRVVVLFASGMGGLCLCLLAVMLSDATRLAPQFPAPGGEDDFAVRASWFFFAVCPAFFLIGAWIGHRSLGSPKRWLAAWTGGVIGTLVVFACVRLMQPVLDTLTEGRTATHAALAFFAAWAVATALGAWLSASRVASAS
ncbi:hypothetical protein [Rhizobacter sp. OV335]|uniref:hypothetical protein n=1 Tax=Rhizobacter sp. OV335 TaxID=1500264 RepID=UPI000915D8C9|nr:hypothetical protein [Rhizobacter sp. OV335]SHM62358.1 hypothetical protein SAMN02787076_01744 [Rhizobacter sp. OV335]